MYGTFYLFQKINYTKCVLSEYKLTLGVGCEFE